MEILKKIVTVKKMEVIDGKKYLPAEKLMKSQLFERTPVSFFNALNNTSPSIIAEFKRKSPSKGVINKTSRPVEVARGYIEAGASAISVLTDREFFGGENNDLTTVSLSSEVPVLRKDFIIDEYQVIEAKSIGAAAILLIASILSRKECEKLTRLALSLGMEVLFEIHDISDLEKMNNNIRIIGVNNRNLNTFKIDRNNAIALLGKLPKDCLKVAESGFNSAAEVKMMFSEGYNAFLIGERFMRSDDPGKSAAEFIAGLK